MALRDPFYMAKLDTSCGLNSKQISIIKYAIKRGVSRTLPLLPESVEMKLFFEGREAWTYSWCLLEQDTQNPLHPLCVEVDVKLKKEFSQYHLRQRRTFLCQLQLQPDIYSAVKVIREKRA